jgi:AAA domain
LSLYRQIDSELDALKIKESEKGFYDILKLDGKIIPKVTPFKGVNTDLLYIKDGCVLFVKFMDTTEEIYSIIDEELLEVMNEEYELLKLKIEETSNEIKYNYVFVMPYITVEDKCELDDFVDYHIIDKPKLEKLKENNNNINSYLKDKNEDVTLNLFLLQVCPEYYTIKNREDIYFNKEFKKINFSGDFYNYTSMFLNEEQIQNIDSIKYGNTLVIGPSGSSKTTIMLSRAIKLARIYPHHKFIVFTHCKQLCNELREMLGILLPNNDNLEIHTFQSFLFKLAKQYELVVDYYKLKENYEKSIKNILLQARNRIKNKSMFKGIFVDEAESFTSEEIDFIKEFLYKSKFIFNIFSCKSKNISNFVNIHKNPWDNIEFDEVLYLKNNYKQTKELVAFSNNFGKNAYDYIKALKSDFTDDYFIPSTPLRDISSNVNILKVANLEEQISSILWEIEYLINTKGLKYSDIAIVYPYNKKKLKNGKTIYFQYMFRKNLEENNIPYVCADEDITNLSYKSGVTISNIYTINNLQYKAVILCELEMLYNHMIVDTKQDYQVNDFVGDLNKVYLGINTATDYLTIVTTFNEDSSDIIKLLMDSREQKIR